MLFVIIVSLLVAGSSAVIVGQGSVQAGPCPNVTGVVIDLNKLDGRWYEYALTDDKYNGTLKCITYELYTPEDGLPRMYTNAISKSTGSVLAVESDIYQDLPGNGVRLVHHIPLVGDKTDQYSDLEVVPDSYEISWSCRNEGSNHVQEIGIYTRSPNPSVDVIGRARQLALEKGIGEINFVILDSNCYQDSCTCQ